MSISALNAFPTAAPERTSTRDTSFSDAASASSFASMFAGAVHAAAPKPVYKPPNEGTSELDGPKDSDDKDDDSGSTTTRSDDASASDKTGTGTVDRSVASLDPALQEKLARVIARVRAETGHDVTVEETYRSQSRQDALFAQGRDPAGPVVTWTQNSKHTQGRAVDLLLDGGAASADAYASLQRIAAEEGLRTLGAKDPGHLELPGAGTGATAHNVKTLNPAEPADATGQGEVSVARVAQVARVAEVKVASPAAVARVANAAAAHVSGVSAGGAEGSKRESSDGSGQGEQRGGYGSLGTTFTMHDLSAPTAPVQATSANGAERVARVMAAMDDSPARPLSQITMSVDAGNGTVDRVHLSLRGQTLNSTIDTADLRTAQTMGAKSDELVRSLTREGLEVESLRVRAVAGNAATVVTQTSQSSSGNSAGSRFERGNPWDQSGREPQSQDGRRQQQREQRKGKDS